MFESLAVALAFAYVVLAIRQNIYCWLASAVSAAIYVLVMYRAGLYMQSALQFFYIAMAAYGWLSWRKGKHDAAGLSVSSWPLIFHLLPVLIILALTWFSGSILAGGSDAAFPYLQSFTAWGPLFATWMVAQKILQNWHYWFVIDSVSVYLFASAGLWPTAGLFVGYLILIVIGYRVWRRDLPVSQ